MRQITLENRIKGGFHISEVYDAESHYSHIRISFYEVFSAGMAKTIAKWIKDALNEKRDRDYGEPLRWIAERIKKTIWGTCPKCERASKVLTPYCPHCGQKLNPPEEE
jgi:hypothetical protein